jgi:hypothetical protein
MHASCKAVVDWIDFGKSSFVIFSKRLDSFALIEANGSVGVFDMYKKWPAVMSGTNTCSYDNCHKHVAAKRRQPSAGDGGRQRTTGDDDGRRRTTTDNDGRRLTTTDDDGRRSNESDPIDPGRTCATIVPKQGPKISKDLREMMAQNKEPRYPKSSGR